MARGAGRGAALHSQQPSKSPRTGSRHGSTQLGAAGRALLPESAVTLSVLLRKAKKQLWAFFSSPSSWQLEPVEAAPD